MIIDIHTHLYKYPYPYSSRAYDSKNHKYKLMFPTEKEVCKMHDSLGIDRAVLQPLVSSEVYVPQSIGEIIEIANNSNGRFIPFCNLDPRVISNQNDTELGFLIEFYKEQGCKGMGEVLPNMPFLDPKLQNLFKHCEKTDMPVLFDMSGYEGYSYGLYDDPGFPQLEKTLDKFPNLTLIGHGLGFWVEFGDVLPEERHTYLQRPIEKEGTVIKLMRSHKNLWVDLSAGSGYHAMHRDKAYTISFLNEFYDRIMFGTDICFNEIPKTILIDYLNELNKSGQLNNEKYECIMHKNAERLLKI